MKNLVTILSNPLMSNILSRDNFKAPKNRIGGYEPEGALFACVYDKKHISKYWQWLLCTGGVHIKNTVFNIFNLKDSAKVYTINSIESYNNLLEMTDEDEEFICNHDINSKIDFERLSKMYDVLYITERALCEMRELNVKEQIRRNYDSSNSVYRLVALDYLDSECIGDEEVEDSSALSGIECETIIILNYDAIDEGSITHIPAKEIRSHKDLKYTPYNEYYEDTYKPKLEKEIEKYVSEELSPEFDEDGEEL